MRTLRRDGKTPPERIPRVDEDECVGCNLCWLVCPVEGCITMEQVETGMPFESGSSAAHGIMIGPFATCVKMFYFPFNHEETFSANAHRRRTRMTP